MAQKFQVIRPRQSMSRIFPHAGNDLYLIPSRFPRPAPTSSDHKTTQVLMIFAGDVTGTTGVLPNGFSVEIDGVPAAVSGVAQPVASEISVTHAIGLVGQTSVCFYDGTGDWVTVSGVKLQAFQVQGTIT